MRRFIAGAMLFIVFLLGSLSLRNSAYAAENVEATVEITSEIAEDSGVEYGNNTEDKGSQTDDSSAEDSEDENAEVLGAQREEGSDRFIICVEVAIGLIFAIGLFAAGNGGYEN